MFGKIRKYFISGLLVFLPLALTIYLLWMAINLGDNLLGKYLQPYFYDQFGFYFPGLGIIIGLYLITLIGFFVTNYIGKKIYAFFEGILVKFPFFRQVYPALKEVAAFLFARDKHASFKKVVLIEYPRKGIHSFGFLTNEASTTICSMVHKDLVSVFIPTSPTPFTGYVVMVPRKDVILTDIGVEQAMKYIVSCGVVNP